MTTTTDTDTLTERIEASAREVMRRSALIADVDLPAYLAAAVLLIVQAEVRKAKAEAWDDCAHEADRRWLIGGQSAAILHDRNPYRETGDPHADR